MAAYSTPLHDRVYVLCILCQAWVSLAGVTAGSLRADGEQAFACTRHLTEREAWITVWALFDIEQKHAHAMTAPDRREVGYEISR